jgi:DNA-binding protein HU-beta
MNKPELISAIAEASGLTKADSSRALDGFISSVTHSLSVGEPVILVGFGTFLIRDRAERKGRNPRTGDEVLIKAAKIPNFKVGKALKDAVNAE